MIGDENLILLTITAANRGEGAYETELRTLLPPEADYIGVKRDAEVQRIKNQKNTIQNSRAVSSEEASRLRLFDDITSCCASSSCLARGRRHGTLQLPKNVPIMIYKLH